VSKQQGLDLLENLMVLFFQKNLAESQISLHSVVFLKTNTNFVAQKTA